MDQHLQAYATCSCECSTHCTFIWYFTFMDQHISFQMAVSHEFIYIHLITGMDQYVLFMITACRKCNITQLTLMKFIAFVAQHVSLQTLNRFAHYAQACVFFLSMTQHETNEIIFLFQCVHCKYSFCPPFFYLDCMQNRLKDI